MWVSHLHNEEYIRHPTKAEDFLTQGAESYCGPGLLNAGQVRGQSSPVFGTGLEMRILGGRQRSPRAGDASWWKGRADSVSSGSL